MKNIGFVLLLTAAVLLSACSEKPEELPQGQPVPVPQNVSMTHNGGTSLTFVWKPVEGARHYIARLENSDGSLFRQLNPTQPSVTFEGLAKGNVYIFKVKTRIGDLVSEYSAPLSVVAGETEATPDPEPDPEPGPDPEPEPGPGEDNFYSLFRIPAHEDVHGAALAFPGAEGGGMYTSGGRGGKVLHVTNLNDSGEGSLRHALEQSGKRTIVFDVAGIIDLRSPLNIKNGDVTIAGQSAPGDGICIRNYTTQVSADNVVIRYLRFRLGTADIDGDGADAIWGRYNSDIMIDHCSMSWSIDECASFYANRNFTMQWCILTESLKNAGHSKGAHGYGGIWGGKDASFHHNMLSNHDSRNPRIDHPGIYGNHIDSHRGNVDYRCNVVYNWGSNVTYGGEDGSFNIVNNYYKMGPASTDRKYFVQAYGYYENYADSYPLLYLSGNENPKYPSMQNTVDAISWKNGSSYANYRQLCSVPHSIEGPSGEDVYVTTHSAQGAFGSVCSYAGASLSRDIVDARACADAVSGKATYKNGIIDKPSDVGGWPTYSADAEESARTVDSDRDGMPDWFETGFGLDKNDASDGNGFTLDVKCRYTNLEMYLHYLVRDITAGQTDGGVYVGL